MFKWLQKVNNYFKEEKPPQTPSKTRPYILDGLKTNMIEYIEYCEPIYIRYGWLTHVINVYNITCKCGGVVHNLESARFHYQNCPEARINGQENKNNPDN